MKLYKAEFFKRDFTLRAAVGIQSPELVFDYLTTEKTEITLPGAVKIARGDWAHVTDINGAVIYQGVVMDITTAITFRNRTMYITTVMPATRFITTTTLFGKSNFSFTITA